jgi:hypothetical protein
MQPITAPVDRESSSQAIDNLQSGLVALLGGGVFYLADDDQHAFIQRFGEERGTYGDITEKLVSLFQEQRALPPSGTVDNRRVFEDRLEAERREAAYDSPTEKLVGNSQTQHQFPEIEILDDRTAGTLSEALRSLGAFDDGNYADRDARGNGTPCIFRSSGGVIAMLWLSFIRKHFRFCGLDDWLTGRQTFPTNNPSNRESVEPLAPSKMDVPLLSHHGAVLYYGL